MFIYFYMNSPDSQRKRGRQSNWGERGCEIEEGKGGGMRERDRRGWRGRQYSKSIHASHPLLAKKFSTLISIAISSTFSHNIFPLTGSSLSKDI